MPDNDAALILGAGFSKAAEMPLTKELFDLGIEVRSQSQEARENNIAVPEAFNLARSKDSELTPEVWLAQLYAERDNVFQLMMTGTRWDHAIRYALARLVNLPKGSKAHYYYGISTYKSHSIHKQFWERIERDFKVKYIVTTNYDISIEQALHSVPSPHRTAPRCRYGGFQHIQTVRKMTDVTTRAYDLIQLGDDFVLYKLHGSINWAFEPHSPTLKIHDDVRAVFRVDDKYGIPAIVPPIPEKSMPPDFGQIWNEAKKVLLQTPIWIICGYSLPDYDQALKNWFQTILHEREKTKLIILDPYSSEIGKKWKILATNCEVVSVSGLPNALSETWI